MIDFEFEEWLTPEDAGISSAGLLKFLDEAERLSGTVQLHSLILLRYGKVVRRFNWQPYDDRTPHTLYSLSKSFCSAAAGFAVQEGLLSWDTSVVDALPDEIPEGREDALRPITLRTLLCMGSGLDPASDSAPEDDTISWARHVLSHDVQYPPMAHFHYNTFGTYLVACMVERAAGEDLVSYLKPRLFDPLGIQAPNWDRSPQGVCIGGFGLYLSSDSIARFGQCLLDHGKWQGIQVLPADWVILATSGHIDNSNGHPDPENEWTQGYGYQFWRCTEGRYRGDGMYGQVCMVDEKLDMVVAATCATKDIAAELLMFRKYLFPSVDAQPGTVGDQEKLETRIAALGYACPADDGTAPEIPEGEYEYDTEWGSTAIVTVSREEDRLCVSFDRLVNFVMGHGEWLPSVIRVGDGAARWLGAYGAENGRLTIQFCSPDGPGTLKGTLSWDGRTLTCDAEGMDCPDGQLVLRPHVDPPED